MPTERGREEMVLAKRIVGEIERRFAELVGAERFAEFKAVFDEIARTY